MGSAIQAIKVYGLVAVWLVLCTSNSVAEYQPPRYQSEQGNAARFERENRIAWNTGAAYGGQPKRYSQPKEVVSVVSLTNGVGTVALHGGASKTLRDVSINDRDSLVVQISPRLTDSTATPASYGWTLSSNRKNIVVKSSNANDSGTVTLRALIR